MKLRGIRLIVTLIMAAIVLFVASAGLIFRLNEFKIEFSVPTGQSDTIEWGESYTPPEVKAYLVGRLFCKSGREIEIKETGGADTSSLGDYKIIWSASAVGIENSGVRTVKVVDTTPPQITLAPLEKDYIYVGETFKEPGYSATDLHDGDLTGQVSVSGVDTSTAGDKEIVYTVSDNSGNSSTEKRIITVKEKPQPKQKPIVLAPVPVVEPQPASPETPAVGGVIYLTFDDGPSVYTPGLLDVLAKYGVKATFFVTGRGDSSLIARAASEGHSIGIHSLTHNYAGIYSSEEAFFADINAMNEIIRQQTGSYTNILRFPGGASNTVSRKYCPGIMSRLTAAVEEQGFRYFDWNVVSGDAGGTTNTDKVYSNVINGIRTKANAIVLQHDTKSFSVNAVERIIVWGLNNGYSFAPLYADSFTVHQRVNN